MNQAPDGSTKTAFGAGIKTVSHTLGFDSSIEYNSATSQMTANRVSTVLEWASNAGKHTGFVTTHRLTRAMPAGLWAHVANHRWECGIPKAVHNPGQAAKDIAWQMIHQKPGSLARVMLGGGSASYRPAPPNHTDYSDDAERVKYNFSS